MLLPNVQVSKVSLLSFCFVLLSLLLSQSAYSLDVTRVLDLENLYNTFDYEEGVSYGIDEKAFLFSECISTCNDRKMDCCFEWCGMESCKGKLNFYQVPLNYCLPHINSWQVCMQNVRREQSGGDCNELIAGSYANTYSTGPRCICKEGEIVINDNYGKDTCRSCDYVFGLIELAIHENNSGNIDYLMTVSRDCPGRDKLEFKLRDRWCKGNYPGSHAVELDSGFKCVCDDTRRPITSRVNGKKKISCENCDSILTLYRTAERNKNIGRRDYLLMESRELGCPWYHTAVLEPPIAPPSQTPSQIDYYTEQNKPPQGAGFQGNCEPTKSGKIGDPDKIKIENDYCPDHRYIAIWVDKSQAMANWCQTNRNGDYRQTHTCEKHCICQGKRPTSYYEKKRIK